MNHHRSLTLWNLSGHLHRKPSDEIIHNYFDCLFAVLVSLAVFFIENSFDSSLCETNNLVRQTFDSRPKQYIGDCRFRPFVMTGSLAFIVVRCIWLGVEFLFASTLITNHMSLRFCETLWLACENAGQCVYHATVCANIHDSRHLTFLHFVCAMHLACNFTMRSRLWRENPSNYINHCDAVPYQSHIQWPLEWKNRESSTGVGRYGGNNKGENELTVFFSYVQFEYTTYIATLMSIYFFQEFSPALRAKTTRFVYPHDNMYLSDLSESHSEWKSYHHLMNILKETTRRIGEAKNPGPVETNENLDMKGLVAVGSINPTSITSKLETLYDLGPGIWSMSETSATDRQQQYTRSFFKSKSWHVVMGKPVKAHRNGVMAVRGVAKGVGLFSSFPSWKSITPLPLELEESCRIVVSFTQLSPNLTIQCVTIYGPHTKAMLSPLPFLDKMMRYALERARSYNGPTIILGDLNYTLDEIPSWPLIKECGFVDAALHDANRRNTLPSPTCKGLTRKTFIIIPDSMVDSMVHCDTLDDHLFDTHPVLRALFRVETLTQAPMKINLPKPVDDFLHDIPLMNSLAEQHVRNLNDEFQLLLQQGKTDEANKIWTNAVEDVLTHTVVDSEGRHVSLNQAYFGRSDPTLIRHEPPSIPIPKPGRDGDFNPVGEYHSVYLRRWLRQVRRLQTMEATRKALNNCQVERRIHVASRCNELWKSIINATGFEGGFINFISEEFQMLPLYCPDLHLISAVKTFMIGKYRHEESQFVKQMIDKKAADIRHDMTRKAGRIAFRQLQDDPKHISPVFHHKETFHIKPQRLFPQGQTTLILDDAHKIDSSLPLCYDGKTYKIQKVADDRVHLTEPIRIKSHCQIAFQTRVVSDDKEKAEMAFGFWNRCWKRDKVDDNQDIVISAKQILDSIPQWNHYPGEKASLEAIKQAMKGIKKKNMRGSCKFSTIELQCIPDCLLNMLVDIFRAIEAGHKWPEQWMTAFVIFLPKVEEACRPEDLRPITVISKLYRLWARMHALQVIKWASHNVAPLIGGGIREVSPADLMTHVQFVIESHGLHHQHLQGLVLDIQKAFNNLHRALLAEIFERLGLPRWLVQPYCNMMSQLERRLVFATFISTGQKSTCGVPEGCPLAVLAMLAYTVAIHSWIKHRQGTVCFYGFADNWSIYDESVPILRRAIGEIEFFCEKMILPLAGDKSWLWSTDTRGRQGLKDIYIQGKHVPIKRNEKELGCDMQYTKKGCRQVFQKRTEVTIRKLKKVTKIPVIKKHQKRLVKGSALATCLYGANLIHSPKTEMHKLRSETARALGGGRAGESPYLTCMYGGRDNVDPELCMMLEKIHILRRMTRKHWFPTTNFLAFVNNPGTRPGPAKALHDALKDWGLVMNTDGTIVLHSGIQVNTLKCNQQYLDFIMEIEWSWVVSYRLPKTRKNWSPCYFDPKQTQKICAKMSEQKAQVIAVHLQGAYYTNDQLARFKTENDSMCPWCSKPDGIEHRLRCASLKSFREKCNLVDTCQDDALIFKHHNICEIPEEVWELYHKLAHKQLVHPTAPPCDLTEITIFVDGSCTDPTITLVRISSGAATVKQGPFACKVLSKELVPGLEQSSSRGEIFAGILALASSYRVHIFTDYLLFHDRLKILLKGNHPESSWKHGDLWNIVFQLVHNRVENICVSKVKAHQDWKNLRGQEQSDAWHNHKVDEAAKDVIKQSKPYPIYVRIIKKLELQRHKIQSYAEFLYTTAMDVFKTKRVTHKHREKFDLQFFRVSARGRPYHTNNHNLEQLLQEGTRFPAAFLTGIVDWYKQLTWQHKVQEVYANITWAELYIDFAMTTQQLAPVMLSKSSSKKAGVFVARDHEIGQHISTQLGTDVFTFAAAIKFLNRKQVLHLPALNARAETSTMIGLSERYAGLAERPKLVNDVDAACWIQKSLIDQAMQLNNLNFSLNHIPVRGHH